MGFFDWLQVLFRPRAHTAAKPAGKAEHTNTRARPAPAPAAKPAPDKQSAQTPHAVPTPRDAPATGHGATTAAIPHTASAGRCALGSVDADVSDAACTTYLTELEHLTGKKVSDLEPGERIHLQKLSAAGAMSVRQIQQALKDIGLFPAGRVDGIFGYRTRSAVRLFQEFARTMDGKAQLRSDGVCGPETQAQLQHWLNSGQKPDWRQKPGEYDAWIQFLERAKAKHNDTPSAWDKKLVAHAGASDTRKPLGWSFGRSQLHLIGIRTSLADHEGKFAGKFTDIFVALIDGLVFKFQGSTEPGSSENASGPPHLVYGQHDYRIRWHSGPHPLARHLALAPHNLGTLTVRTKTLQPLTDEDAGLPLQPPNPTIHIHWGGAGLDRDVAAWSAGCQVIGGGVYINPAQALVDCRKFVAANDGVVWKDPTKTRGAFNVLTDLVATHAAAGAELTYVLLPEEDLDLAADLKASLDKAREDVLHLLRVQE